MGVNEKRILGIIAKNKFITIIQLAKDLAISTTAVENNIRRIKGKRLLKRIGPAKGGYWEVKK